MKLLVASVGVVLGISFGCCLADLVVGKDGNIIEGKIISQDESMVSIRAVATRRAGEPETLGASQMIVREKIARVILTDAHGGAVPSPSAATKPAAAWGFPPEPAPPPVVAAVSGPTYYVVPLRGEIGEAVTAALLERSLADAEVRKPTVVVLDMESPGGSVSETEEILLVLHRYNKRLRMVALAGKCLSAAAVTALSVREIYVRPNSAIGAATAYKAKASGLPEAIEEKAQSAWRAVARNSAEEGGHDPLLAEAMIDSEMELHLADANGKTVVRSGPGDAPLCRKGKLLTLTSHEAVRCGLAAGDAEDLAELGQCLKMPDWRPLAGLAPLLADYQAKRLAVRDEQFERIGWQVQAHMREAVEAAPFAGVYLNRITTVLPNPSPGVPRPYGPGVPMIRPMVPTPMPGLAPGVYRPGMGIPRPGIPYPYGPQPPSSGQTVITRTEAVVPLSTRARWYQKSLACVIALQQVEEDFSEAIALSRVMEDAEGQEYLTAVREAFAKARTSVYEERFKYGKGDSSVREDSRIVDRRPAEAVQSVRIPAPQVPRKPVEGEFALDLGRGVRMILVPIPAGKFMMGSPPGEKDRQPDEDPQHEVTVTKPFYMGVYPVTDAQYGAVVGRFSQLTAAPATYVSWEQAVQFCSRLSRKMGKTVRLPTEAEWEYACRAGGRGPYYFGADPAKEFPERAGGSRRGSGGPRTVGLHPPNAWGLYDMHGCVWQWCSDFYGPYAATAQRDPKGLLSGDYHVRRGGASESSDALLRDAARDKGRGAHPATGFRVVVEHTE